MPKSEKGEREEERSGGFKPTAHFVSLFHAGQRASAADTAATARGQIGGHSGITASLTVICFSHSKSVRTDS